MNSDTSITTINIYKKDLSRLTKQYLKYCAEKGRRISVPEYMSHLLTTLENEEGK